MVAAWQDIHGNPAAYDRLCETMRSRQAISFVGAGASAGLYPLWTDLMKQLADAAVGASSVSSIERDYWLGNESDPQEAADFLRGRLGGRYPELLRELFSPRRAADGQYFTSIHRYLMRLPFRGFVTTNYDPGLLEARKVERPVTPGTGFGTWSDVDIVRRWLNRDIFSDPTCPVMFAHGYYERSGTVVLGDREYRKCYTNESPFITLMTSLLGQERLVFFGFGFSDPWLKFIAEQALSRTGARETEAPRHFALIGQTDLDTAAPRRQRFNRAYHADPVFYPVIVNADGSEDHSALLAILEALVADTRCPAAGGASGFASMATAGSTGSSKSAAEPPPSLGPGSTVGQARKNAHELLTIGSLERANSYLAAIKNEIKDLVALTAPPQTARDVVAFFAQTTDCSVQELFKIVRRALSKSYRSGLDEREREPVANAALALFCLAACRLVDTALCAAHLRANDETAYLFQLVDAEPILCGLIATALSGCKLEFVPANDDHIRLTGSDRSLPYPSTYFHIKVPDGWDITASNFERALYLYVVDGYRGETASNLSDRALEPNEKALLFRRLKDFSEIDDITLVITLDNSWPIDASRTFANLSQILMFIEDKGTTTETFGMPIPELRAYISELWRKIVTAAQGDKREPPAAITKGDTPVNSTSPTITINNVLATGERAVAHAGSGNTVNTGDQSQVTPEAFAAMLRDLAGLIGQAPEEAKAHLRPSLSLIEAEVNKPKKTENSVGFIKGLLENIKAGAEGLENGSKIVAICNRAYQAVGPLFGLPPSPLP